MYMCDGCNTSYHTECLSELGRCAVAGCSKPFTGQISDGYSDGSGALKGLLSKALFSDKPKPRRGPELHPRSTSRVRGVKSGSNESGLSAKEKFWGVGTIALAVVTFIGFCYLITYGIAFLAMLG